MARTKQSSLKGFTEVAQKLHDRAYAAVRSAFENDIFLVAEQAVEAWPVDTGESRGSIFARVDSTTPAGLFVSIGATADYAGVIAAGRVAESLLIRPARVAARRAAIRIGRIAAGLERP